MYSRISISSLQFVTMGTNATLKIDLVSEFNYQMDRRMEKDKEKSRESRQDKECKTWAN